MLDTLSELALLVVLLAVVGLVVGAVLKNRLGGGGSSMTTVVLGATDGFLNEDRRKAAETIVNENAGKKFEAQQSGEPQTPGTVGPDGLRPRLAFTMGMNGGTPMITSVGNFRKSTWRIRPRLEPGELQPPVVLFSVFDEDPRAGYEQRLKEFPSAELLPGATGLAEAKELQRARFAVSWDSIFREVPGNKISMVFQEKPARRTTGSAKRRTSVSKSVCATMIMSNSPAGKKWIVTRAARCGNRTVSWCVPIEVQLGKTSRVTLSSRNMIVLGT